MSRLRLLAIPAALLFLTAGVALADEPEESPPHRLIESTLDRLRDPESWLRSRLGEPPVPPKGIDAKKLLADPDIQNLAKKLLADPEFLQSVQNSLSRDDINRLKGMIDRKEDIAGDDTFRKLAEKFRDNPGLTEKDAKILDKIKDAVPPKTDAPKIDDPKRPETSPNDARPKEFTRPEQMTPPATDNGLDTFVKSEWAKNNLRGLMRNLEGMATSGNGKWLLERAQALAKRASEARSDSKFPEMAAGARRWSESLPKLSSVLPSRALPSVRPPSLPSMPRVGTPSMPTADGAKGILTLLVVVGLAALLWRFRGWFPDVIERARRPWLASRKPVAPGDITTRADLVRAYEYLALATLGDDALPRHHNDLARKMAALPSGEPQRRKEALDTLARLYEAARYTPDDERLPEADMQLARREMTHLSRTLAA